VLAGVLVAGCGHGSDTPKREPAPEATRAATVRISIQTPRPGARARFGRPLRVTGRATAGTTVLVTACVQAGCSAVARAGADGRWRASVRPRDARTTIEAATAGGDAGDRVRILVTRPQRAAPTTEAEPQATPRPLPKRVVVIGDSLAVGMRDDLPAVLPDFQLSVDAVTGRPLAAGMAIARQTDTADAVLALSLFTNDDPRHVDELDAAVRASVRASRCAVWATIVRPPYGGVSYRTANVRLQALAAELGPRLQIVPWAETIAAEPELLEPDGVHATAAGYHRRAVLYAEAVRACANSA
jgi:hypothetical protein